MMKFTIIVVGMVALAVLMAGCTSQEGNVVDSVPVVYEGISNTTGAVYTDSFMNVSSTQAPLYANKPVMKTEDNKSYQLTGAEVQGCAIAAYQVGDGIYEVRNAPNNPPECLVNGVGRG